jgi:chemotaxis signal transduction protein
MNSITKPTSPRTDPREPIVVPTQASSATIDDQATAPTQSEFLSVDAWGATCLVPLQNVQRVLPMAVPTPIPGGADSLVGVLRVSQESILIHDLGLLLHRTPTSLYSATFAIVIIADQSRKVGIVVKSANGIVESNDIDGFSDLPRDHLATIDGLASIGSAQLLVLNAGNVVREVLD